MKNQFRVVLIMISMSVLVCFSLQIRTTSEQPFVRAQLNETSSEFQQGANAFTNQTKGAEVEFDLFYDPELGISMQFPNDWRATTNGLQDYSQLISFYSPLENLSDAAPVQVTISRIDYLENITQNDYTAFTLNATSALGINGTESNATLSQRPATQLITSFPPNQISPGTDVLQVWTVNNGSVYVVRYLASSDKFLTYMPIVEQMITSFQADSLLEPVNASR